MAYQENLTEISLPANADLSTKQYFFVKITNSSGTGRVAVAGDGESAVGILQNKPSAAGNASRVAIAGICKVYAGGTITAGSEVASDASGECVAAATGDIVLGTAVNSAVDGDVVEIIFNPRNAKANNIDT